MVVGHLHKWDFPSRHPHSLRRSVRVHAVQAPRENSKSTPHRCQWYRSYSTDRCRCVVNTVVSPSSLTIRLDNLQPIEVNGGVAGRSQKFRASISVVVILGCRRAHLNRLGVVGTITSFVSNFLLILTVKEFWKSVNICQSYERM